MSDPGDEMRQHYDDLGNDLPMTEYDWFQTLVERRNYLAARIKAKLSVGWQVAYDERECKALTTALGKLSVR